MRRNDHDAAHAWHREMVVAAANGEGEATAPAIR
jgi:hypothetical protein